MSVGALLTILICLVIIASIIASAVAFVKSLLNGIGGKAEGALGSKSGIVDTATKILAIKEALDVVTGGNKK